MSEADIAVASEMPAALPQRRSFPWISLMVCLVLSYAAVVPALRYPPDGWFAALERPWFTPDQELVGYVFLALLALNAIALWRVWNAPKGRWWASILFVIQLALAGCWLPMLLGARELGLSLSVLAMTCLFALLTQRRFLGVDRIAGLLLWPWLIWLAWILLLSGFLLWYNV